MKQSNAVAYLRRLCCSGFSKEIVIAEFLRAVPTLIASCNNTFSGTDSRLYPKYHIAGFEIGAMQESIPAIVASSHTPAKQQRALNWFKHQSAITDARIIDPDFFQSELYHQVYKPFDMHHVLWMPVSNCGRPVGMLGLYRPKHQKPFGSREHVLLGQLLQYVSHALDVEACQDNEYAVADRSGMMIMSTGGEILCQSREAEQLLNMVRHPRLQIDKRSEDRLQAKLLQLCSNLAAVYRGEPAAPPSYCHTNAYGQFLFRAYRLNDKDDSPQHLLGLTIEHREPLTLKVLRAMKNLPLSPMQQEVAQFVALGLTFDSIGKRLNIKPTTVKDHVGKIYTKLDIGQRDELLPKLLALAS